jgi:hypothetical protein
MSGVDERPLTPPPLSGVTPLVWLQDGDRLMYAREEELDLSKLVSKYINPLDFSLSP